MKRKHKHTRMIVQTTFMTTTEIELTLKRAEYMGFWRKYGEAGDKQIINSVYKDSGKMVEEFNKMNRNCGWLTSQRTFVLSTRPMIEAALMRAGVEITPGILNEADCRSTRTYMGALVEMHVKSLFLELIPGIRIIEGDRLDLDGGVDFYVEEYHTKDIYPVHVTSDDEGPEWIIKKGERGNYARDFSNHFVLTYCPHSNVKKTSTKHIRIFPLFTEKYILEQWEEWKKSGKAKNYYKSDFLKMAETFEKEDQMQEIRITYKRETFEANKKALLEFADKRSA